jgi:hypothetical protein
MVIQAGAYLTLMVTFRAFSVHQRYPGWHITTPISCHAALNMAASAPFFKESRMMIANATNFYRKSEARAADASLPQWIFPSNGG